MKYCWMEHCFTAIDVLDKTFDAAQKCEILCLATALIDQLYLDSVIQKREFAQSFTNDVVVKLDVAEYLFICQKMDLRAPFLRGAENF